MKKINWLALGMLMTASLCHAQQAPDNKKWFIMNQQGYASANGELQCYKPAQATVSGGMLSLTAKVANSTHCPDYGDGVDEVENYASGELYSQLTFTYGAIEYRAQFSGGTGTWPAIWMIGYTCHPPGLNQVGVDCNWPNPGANELDITEIQSGAGTQPYQNTFPSDGGGSGELTCRPTVTDVTSHFHVYDFQWNSSGLTWWIDGSQTCQVLASQHSTAVPTTAMFLILNVAVGGSLGGSVNNGTLPQSTQVDYIKVTNGSYSGGMLTGTVLLDDEFNTLPLPPASINSQVR